MPHASPPPAHALRLDPPSVLQATFAATISMLVAWLIQTVSV